MINWIQRQFFPGGRGWAAVGPVACLLVLAWGTGTPGFADEALGDKQATGKHGMVSAAHPLAAQAGLEMLSLGGNAADAAAATAFALTVVEPFGSSIGGDGTALIYEASTGNVEAINYRCSAPALASYDVLDFSHRDDWGLTLKAAGVPGLVAGTCALHARHGRLPLSTVLGPAIRFAEKGFTVTPKLASILLDNFAIFENNEEAGRVFLEEGLPLDAGATIRNPDLASSLQRIAELGPEVFYTGALARTIDTFMAEQGGFIRCEDLKIYEPRISQAIHVDYRGLRVFTTPPPFGGISVLQGLNVLSCLPLNFDRPFSDPDHIHIMAEVMKGVSLDRSRMIGDPTFVEIPMDFLLSREYAQQRARTVDLDRATIPTEVKAGSSKDVDYEGNTTHLSVVDCEGNAVAITQTLGRFFGCGVMVPGTGIMLNSQVRNFSGPGSSPNTLAPGKQMRSTQSPVMVMHNRELILVLGSPGDFRIVTTVLQVLVNYIDYGMSLMQAVDAERFTAWFRGSDLELESRLPPESVERLREMGHQVELRGEFDLYFGGVHAISRDPARNVLTGVADRRRDGVARAGKPCPGEKANPPAE